MKRCLGFTLIEVIVALTIGSTIALLGVTMVHKSMEFQEVASRRMELTQVVDRIGVDFRRTVRTCHEVRLEGPNQIVIVCNSDTEIRYRFEQDGYLYREHTGGRNAIQKVSLASKEGMLPRRCDFEVEGDFVRLQIVIVPGQDTAATQIERSFVAEAGRWSKRIGALSAPESPLASEQEETVIEDAEQADQGEAQVIPRDEVISDEVDLL